MEILEVKITDYETAYVEAIVEDVVLVHSQTLYDPPEYGPSRCYTHVNISDVMEYFSDVGSGNIVTNLNKSITQYVEENDLDWHLCERDY